MGKHEDKSESDGKKGGGTPGPMKDPTKNDQGGKHGDKGGKGK